MSAHLVLWLIKKILLGILFLALFTPVQAQTPSTTPLVASKTAPTEVLSIDSMIDQSAQKWGLNRRILARIIDCESGGDIRAVGDHGTSFGIVQIHLSAHPDITKTQAFDPEFSIDYLAKEISQGHGGMWSCY